MEKLARKFLKPRRNAPKRCAVSEVEEVAEEVVVDNVSNVSFFGERKMKRRSVRKKRVPLERSASILPDPALLALVSPVLHVEGVTEEEVVVEEDREIVQILRDALRISKHVVM
jgi:hypothetical protein